MEPLQLFLLPLDVSNIRRAIGGHRLGSAFGLSGRFPRQPTADANSVSAFERYAGLGEVGDQEHAFCPAPMPW